MKLDGLAAPAVLRIPMVCFWGIVFPIGSMYAIYGKMDPINIPPDVSINLPAPWIPWVINGGLNGNKNY
jgi:hypothetical protein